MMKKLVKGKEEDSKLLVLCGVFVALWSCNDEVAPDLRSLLLLHWLLRSPGARCLVPDW